VLKSADNKTAPLEITILPDPSPWTKFLNNFGCVSAQTETKSWPG
jgi:hypothetical protein